MLRGSNICSGEMPACRCIVQDCNNKSNPQAGISLYKPKTSKEAATWKAFVRTHRKNFNPQGPFKICSVHFVTGCFARKIHIEGAPRRTIPGAIPTTWRKSVEDNSTVMSARSRRQVSRHSTFDFCYHFGNVACRQKPRCRWARCSLHLLFWNSHLAHYRHWIKNLDDKRWKRKSCVAFRASIIVMNESMNESINQ